MKWELVEDKLKFGIVISNLKQEANFSHRLNLSVGDTVYILEELDEWYYGCSLKERTLFGLFPKCYVKIKDAVIDKTGARETVIAREPPIVQEITAVLREWGAIWKQLYIQSSANFVSIQTMMLDLIDWRRQIMSGTLPADELKILKHKITSKIDQGNAILGLDLVVRDEHGNILNPEITSTVDLYRAHEAATRQIRQNTMGGDTKSKLSNRYNHNLYVIVKNFVCRIGEDSELLISLYDTKESRFISENYFVEWGKEGLMRDLDQLNNLRVVFSDLGSKDLARERVFLVCQVIRIGNMELKEFDARTLRKSSHPVNNKKMIDEKFSLRRPFGVAAIDITEILNEKVLNDDEDKDHFAPFLQCGEKDSLDSVIRKMISIKEISSKDHKGQGLHLSFKMLHGDQKQIREEYAHLVSPFTAVARKMGFPEVILPGDVRNDTYLTLMYGEFSKGSKKSERNVEVTVKVCNEKGQVLKGALSYGAGSELKEEYRTVVYYHEERPKWMETIKVAIPIEDFKTGHLKFTFRHRSSNDNKDKSEKPFALSYVRLMHENRTTLRDQIHELLVYKVDHKKYDENDISYLNLPSTRVELEEKLALTNQGNQIGAKQLGLMFQFNGISLSAKDSFTISSIVCSTKLTQNIDLLGLLNWRDNPLNLKAHLHALMKVDGEEIVKFLQDTLDALFEILMQNTDSDLYDKLVFEALIFIIGLISDRKYHHFRPVLDVYIEENFSATLVYNKLIVVLKNYIDNMSENQDILLKAMKSLEYIFKFIVRSRMLFAALNGGKGKTQFEESLKSLLQSITFMMTSCSDTILLVQGACLKYFPFAITDILSVFNEKELSYILTDLINNVPVDRLTKQKMMCVNDIVHCELFVKYSECRSILLPVINDHIRLLLERRDELELVIKIISDMLTVLHGRDVGPIQNDISDIMLLLLRTVIQTVIDLPRDNSLVGNLVAIMIGILRQMTPSHYEEYINSFPTRTDLLDFLMEILCVFKDLVTKNVFPKDWNEMILLQNSVFLNALRHFAQCIRSHFLSPFEVQVWNNFFHCAITFLTQEALQLESFTTSKRNKILSRYRDMRRETAFEIRSMWFHLGSNKIEFVPTMVGPFLEMTLIPETELRKAIIPIFFDMMMCEFYSPKSSQSNSLNEHDSMQRERRFSFKEFETEMITQLDVLIEGGRGDEQFKDLFCEIVGTQCEHSSSLREEGLVFVRTVTRLMRRLLEYRVVAKDDNKENKMSCTVNLLEFYNEIDRKEMYIRYLYKLCDLHLECENYTEAAYTLALHSRLLRWSDEPLPQLLKNAKYPHCETHRELKERLYCDIIELFDKGKLWEAGIAYCKELISQYETEIFDYTQLSALLQTMATFYDNIIKQARPEPEYFRVSYYGKGFPVFLQNKTFIYRGKEYERLSEFNTRLLNQFPNAQLMSKLGAPGDEIIQANVQYLQISKVDPVMLEREKFRGKAVHEQILHYYKVNEVQKFAFSRPIRRGEKDSDNDFASMWIERTTFITSYPFPGILRWFPVTQHNVFELSPLENAIETMEHSNNKIRDLIIKYRSDFTLPLNPLSLALKGIVEADVMGGIANYENAFFSDEYIQKCHLRKEQEKIAKLKDLIASQIPLLEASIAIHGQRTPQSLKPLQEHMEATFAKMKKNVEEKYGKKSLPSDLAEHLTVKMRRGFVNRNKPNLNTQAFSPERKSSNDETGFLGSPIKSLRSKSVFVKANGQSFASSTSTLTKLKKQVSRDSMFTRRSNESTSLWYADHLKSESTSSLICPKIELTEQLITHRPLRSEIDKRLSRPGSGQFRTNVTPSPTRSLSHALSSSSLTQSSSLSITQAKSSDENEVDDEEIEKPPPLPAKQSFVDYSNLLEDRNSNGDLDWTIPIKRNSGLMSPVKNKPPPPLPSKPSPPHSPSETSPQTPVDLPELPKKPTRRVPAVPQDE